MSSTEVRGGGFLRAAVLWSSAVISALLIIRALHLGYDLGRPVPFYDQWEFVRRIGDVLSGRFGFADLVAQHNEHRIATARVVFLLDLWLADGTGYLSIAVLYLALAAIAALLARCFAGDRGEVTTVFLLSLALLLSPAQWENLSSGFQVQFPFVDLFAILSLSCLTAALTSREGRRWAWLCLAAASLCDVLAIFSMASGTLLLIPALWIGLVLRSGARLFFAYVATHLAACALFAFHFARNAGIPPVFDPVLLLQYAIVYMGAALRGYPHGPFALGLLDLLCLSATLTSMLLRSRAGPSAVDRVQLFAASVALLLAANALLTAVGRSSFGMASAVASRYAIQSLLLQPALLVVLWREGRRWLVRPAARSLLGAGLLVGGTALSLSTNLSDVSLQEWRDRVDRLDRAGFALAEGLFDDDVLRLVYPEPGSIRQAARQFVARRLGPVSMRYGGLYRPPSDLPVGADLDAVGACTAAFGLAQDGSGSSRRLEGWAFDPRVPTGGGLAVVLDRSDGDRVVGLGRQSIRRDDVDRALDVSVDRSGFDIPLKIATDHRGEPTSLTLLIVPEQADRPVCAGTVSASPGQR